MACSFFKLLNIKNTRQLVKPLKCYIGNSNPRLLSMSASKNAKVLTPYVQANSQILPKLNQQYISCVRSTSTETQAKEHNHVAHWTAERILTLALLGVIPTAVILPSTSIEYLLAISLTLHSHWGIEAIVVDYIRPSIFGKIIPKVSVLAVYGLSALTLGGLLYFIYTDVGLINAVKLLWRV